ncbi:hypothetical protein Tco_0369678, partial [Tanacetum coccineum]
IGSSSYMGLISASSACASFPDLLLVSYSFDSVSMLSVLTKLASTAFPIPCVGSVCHGILESRVEYPEEDIRLDDQLFYDDTLSDDDSFKDIDYVEASPPDSELASLEEVKDFDTKDGEINTNILLTIKDDILLSLFISYPRKDSDFFLEKSETFLSLPELETFRFDIEEKNSGSTTVHADISLPEYDSFHFEIEPDQGELTRVVVEDIFDNLTRELYVHVPNVLPTLVDRLYLFLTYVIRLFLPYFTYPVESPFLLSPGSDDTIFDPDISAFYFSSLKLAASHRSGTFICVNVYPNILNEISMKICSSTCVVPNFTMIWGESS